MSRGTTIREAIRQHLATAIPTYTWVAGRVEGKIDDRLLGCIFPSPDYRAEDPVVDYVNYRYEVRAFLRFTRSNNRLSPPDPAPLELLEETIVVALSGRQILVDVDGWFLRTPRSRIDLDVQGVAVEVVARAENVFVTV